MNDVIARFFDDWNWGSFFSEVAGKATGVTVGILLSWFLVIRRRLQSMGRLQRGDSDDLLFQAHYLQPISNDDYQLLFRNVAEKRTIEQVYDNPAAARLVRELGDETALDNPILPTQGTIGFEILNDAAGWIGGALATSPTTRSIWLFCLTAEDRKVVRKRCVRAFMIRPTDLKRFHDWQWCCQHVRVERPWHWFRIVALHRVARYWADQCRIYSQPVDPSSMPLVDDQCGHRRIVSLSLGLLPNDTPISDPVVIDWDHQLHTLAASDLTLVDGTWPQELPDQ